MKRKYIILKPLLTKSGSVLEPGTEIEGEEKDLKGLVKKGAIRELKKKARNEATMKQIEEGKDGN